MDRNISYYSNERKKEKPPVLLMGLVAVIILALLWFIVPPSISRNSEPVKENLTIGINPPFCPFECTRGGNLEGFDVDLGVAIGEKLNRKVVFNRVRDFSALFPMLAIDEVDILVSAVTITPERENISDFSVPYFTASQAGLITGNSKFKSSGNLSAKDFEGMKVGYQELTTSQTWVENNLIGKVNLASNASFGDLDAGILLLRRGVFDVIIIDEPVARVYGKSSPDLKMAGTIPTNEEYAVVVKEGDPQKILLKINEAIEEMKKNGDYDKLIAKHFGGEKK